MTERTESGFTVSHGQARAVCSVCEDGSVYVTDWRGGEDPYDALRVFQEGHAEARHIGAPRFVMHVPIIEAAGPLGEFYENVGFEPKYVIYEKKL